MNKTKRKWEDAKKDCEKQKGSLAIITNKFESMLKPPKQEECLWFFVTDDRAAEVVCRL